MRRDDLLRRVTPALCVLLAALFLATAAQASPGTAPATTDDAARSHEQSGYSRVALTGLLLAFVLLVLLPFAPGVSEIYRPRDQYPLPVNTEYVKDPRYLGRSAWTIVRQALNDLRQVDGRHEVPMSKNETVEVSGSRTVAAESKLDSLLYVRGDLTLQERATSERDLFVEGSTHLAPGCQVRAIACEGEVTLRRDCVVTRWIDAGGAVEVGPGCAVGVSLASPRTVRLAEGATFHRLSGDPIETPESQGIDPPLDGEAHRPRVPEKIRTIEDVADYRGADHRVGAGEGVQRPLVVKGDLTVGERATLHGSVRVYGRTKIESGVLLHGDLFCEGPVEIGEGVKLIGNLFSQEDVALGRGVRVGRAGAPKSVIARTSLRLERDVRIYGYVLAEGEGVVL